MLEQDCSALILAGGRGQRMQTTANKHTEKCLQQINNKSLASLAFDSIPNSIQNIYVSANTNQNKYKQYTKGLGAVIPDAQQYPSYSGPLAGIASVMQKINTQWLYVLPADVVFTPLNLFNQLQQSIINTNSQLTFVSFNDRVHPLFMLVNINLLDNLNDYLMDGQRRVQAWVKQNGVACDVIARKSAMLDDNQAWEEYLFSNINTPDDLVMAYNQCLKS